MSGQAKLNNDGLAITTSPRRSASSPFRKAVTFASSESSIAAPHDHRHHTNLPWIIRLLDCGTVVGATVLTVWIGSHMVPANQANIIMLASLAATLVFFLTWSTMRAPSLPFLNTIFQQIRFLVPSLLIASLIEAGVLWWLGWAEWPLIRAVFAWMAAATSALLITRTLSNYVVGRPAIEQRLTRKIAIIGYDEHAFRVADIFAADSQKGIIVAGVFSDTAEQRGQPAVDGSISSLISLSQQTDLHGIIIALPPSSQNKQQISRLSWELRSVLANVFVMPYLVPGPVVHLPIEPIGSLAVLVLQRRPLNEWQMIVKKVIDITISLVALLLLFPVLLFVAVAIKLDSRGPVLYCQSRGGCNSRQFQVYKFRSMHENKADFPDAEQTCRGDPRVTRVGKWLRQFSIDEMPQLINVFRGEMSLVGPRPHALQTRIHGELLNDVTADYAIRFQVKPGMTGWAQVNGARGELACIEDLHRRIAYDLEYIQHWSAWFDLKIMLLTVVREIVSTRAF